MVRAAQAERGVQVRLMRVRLWFDAGWYEAVSYVNVRAPVV